MRPIAHRIGVAALTAIAVVALGACGPSARRPSKPRLAKPLPADAYAHYMRGRMAMHEADFADAITHFRTASQAAPNEAPIRVALADALLRAGHKVRAVTVAEASQRTFADVLDVWLVSGRIYRAIGRTRDAVRAYERAVRLAPKEERAYVRLGAAWIVLQQPRRAEATYRLLLRRVPTSVSGSYLLAARLLARGAYRAAITAARVALRGNPNHVRALVVLARALRATGDNKRSIAILRRAFDRSNGDAAVGEKLFYQLLEAGARSDAIRLLGLLDRDDLPAATRVTFGYLLLQVHARRTALGLAKTILAAHPENDEARLLEAHAAAELGRRVEAIKLLLAISSSSRAYASARAMAAELLARDGKLAAARAIVDAARVSHSRHSELVVADAAVHRLSGAPSLARLVFAKALHARPRSITLLYEFAELESELGHSARAVKLAEKVLILDAEHPEAMNFIGYSLADRGLELARAERLLRAAMALSPGNGYVLDSFGWLLFRQGKLDAAEKVLRQASHLTPAEPEILWHLAELRIARRDRRGALVLLNKARLLDPRGKVRARIKARIQALRSDKW